ncbi:MAG: hypothetical protein K0S27_1161 [Gammaproteobacteria bacterium]|nr:hypothetical protein [Gammaproteobacteria bacterium]
MKKAKKKNLLLLAALTLISAQAFSANTAELSFDLSNKDQPDAKEPFFYCEVVDNSAVPLGLLGARVNFQILDKTIKFNDDVSEYNDLAASTVNDNYFEVRKGDMQGKGTVRITVSEKSDITCFKGKGSRSKLYNP